jgi:hypothetical protein
VLGVLLLLLFPLVTELLREFGFRHGLRGGISCDADIELLRVKDVLLLGKEGGMMAPCILLFKFIDKDDDLWRDLGGSGGAGNGMDS